MRRSLFLYLFISHVFCFGQSPGDIIVSPFSCSDNLEVTFNQLSQQTGVNINYKNETVQGKSCSYAIKEATLDQILTAICAQNALVFRYIDNAVVIKPTGKGATIYGIVIDESTNERISDAVVLVQGARTAVSSDANGNFRCYTSRDSAQLMVQASGFQTLRRTLPIENNRFYIIRLNAITAFKEVAIEPTNLQDLKNFDEIKPNTQATPTVGGELDALSNIKLLAGVQNVSFGESGLIVRGGGPDQNLVLLDGIPVYNTFHIMGLYSIFNSSSINNIKVYKDIYPANYSSRLSSVVDVGLNNGSKKQWNAQADLGIISSGLQINGPLVKDKLSFSGSIRRSYADAIIKPIQNVINDISIQNNATNLWFYDVYGKLHYQINNKNELGISFFNGGDQLQFQSRLELRDANKSVEQTDGSLGWRNQLVGLQWLTKFNSKLFATARVAYSAYNVDFQDMYSFIQTQRFTSNSTTFKSGLSEYRASLDFDWFANENNHTLYGAGIVEYDFEPFTRTYTSANEIYSSDTTFNATNTTSTETYVYGQNKTYFGHGSATVGVRFVSFLRGDKRYNSFQPRVLINQNLNKRLQFHIGLSSIDQFVHLVPNNNLGLPIDIWLPVTNNIQPLHVEQVNAGIKGTYEKWSWKSTVFSKTYDNLLEYKTGVNLLNGNANWDLNFDQGTGRSYGAEAQISAQLNDWYLFGSYTYNRSIRQLISINDNQEYFSKYDRPHTINLLAQYDLSAKSRFIFSFSFASGNPISLPVARYTTVINGNQIVVEEFDQINNFRLPATHHLDIAYQRSQTHDKFESTLVVGVYNMYNQLNPFMAFIGLDEEANPSLKIRSYLPIMPMFKYIIKI